MLLACRDKSEARRWWLVQARRVSQSIYAPLGPICLEHQDLCRGYSALGPSRVPPIYFYGSVLPAAAGTRNRVKVARWCYSVVLRKGKCYRKHARGPLTTAGKEQIVKHAPNWKRWRVQETAYIASAPYRDSTIRVSDSTMHISRIKARMKTS